MCLTRPASPVEIVPARDDANGLAARRPVRVSIVDETTPIADTIAEILTRTRVERSGHFTPPRFS